MLDLSQPYEFEWNEGNKDKNWLKHGIGCREAEEVFLDEKFVLADDQIHSYKEKRFWIIGQNQGRQLLFITFTLRNKKIRIISARIASKKERQLYVQK